MNTTANTVEYKNAVYNAVLDEDTFLRLTLSKRLIKEGMEWDKISIRPVLVKDRRRLQFSYFDGKKDITKNYACEEAKKHLTEALDMPFANLHLQATTGDLVVRHTKKGKTLVTKTKPSLKREQVDLSHDRVKRQPLQAGKPDEFLIAVGVLNKQGEVRPSMQAKLHQINEFLRITEQTVLDNVPSDRPVRIVDCGCGSAYLTFAAYHYLTHEKNLQTHVTGIDVNAELIQKTESLRDSLGWKNLDFLVSSIADFSPDQPPDVVLSLHACDTATDEAIAQGIRWNSRVILAAPCCQHELNGKLGSNHFRAVMRHGILRERLADILTDAFRASILRIMGYRADVIEFISPEHTAKNLMIRAVRGPKPGDPRVMREYRELKEFWSVTPYLESLLEGEF